ncbi:hypothetical protein CNMCM6805_007852 [Aspergillus fumigatiaffinis]|uniref:C2H2-type domain-containing protein n=1 Tax=Aspergillus fumigatiaffinis TaxID=340414 RepID=A0A8H4H5Z4_9EURO|nr:hypothetical protein CNMCM6805_007852 [Aspergillus fumigatiaffinis]
MDPLNNGHIIDDFNYEQDDMYAGSNVIWRAVRYAGPPVQTLGAHLAPAPPLDMSFTHSQTPFFAPVSPSSIGSTGAPAQLSGPETGTNYNFEALDLTDGNLVPPEVPLSQGDWPGQWPTIGSLDAGPVQMPSEPQDAAHSPLAKVNQLRNDLQLWDSSVLQALPELNYSQLVDLRSFVKTTFCKLDTSIQERLDLGAPNIPSPRDRYLCKLCSQGNRKVYGTRGTFRRHVSLTHQAEHKYYCPACSFSTPRRDKFRGHLQVKHGSFALTLLNKGCLDNLARPCPPPKTCGLCPKQVNTWKRYFECVVKHCRLAGGSSAYTSASQSRRGSGNTGGDGTDFGGQQGFGPSGNDGSGFPPSSSFEGDNMDGGDYDFSSIGQQFSFHAASLSQHNTQASVVADTIDEAEQSPPLVTNARARTRPNSVPNEDGPEHLSSVRSPTSLRDYHRTLNSTLKEGSPASTKRNPSLDSFKQLSTARNAPHSSDSSGRTSGSHALDLSEWDNVPDGIARKQLPLFRTEVHMQLLDDALDLANPDLTDTTEIMRRRPHMLQTRLRVVVKLLKLKTTVANVVGLEAPKAVKPRTSEITPDYPGLIEFTVDLPIRDETLSLSQFWSMMISNAGMIVGGFASTALDIPNLNDGRDDLQFIFMMLIHILMKFAGAPIRPVNTMLVE